MTKAFTSGNRFKYHGWIFDFIKIEFKDEIPYITALDENDQKVVLKGVYLSDLERTNDPKGPTKEKKN